MDLLLVSILGFSAGLIDALAGGGGMIQVPGLMIICPAAAPATILACNKVASFSGTFIATLSLGRRVAFQPKVIICALSTIVIASVTGAYLATLVPSSSFKPLAAGLLIVAVLVSAFSSSADLAQSGSKQANISFGKRSVALGLVAGLYDGFFGPGLGTIVTLLCVTQLHMPFMCASLHAKALNVLSNGGALIYFIYAGYVNWQIAIPMAISNILGAVLGAQLILLRGSKLVRFATYAMSCAILVKLCFGL